MIRRTALVIFASVFVIAWTSHAFAQGGAVAQLVGAVTDESGGVLPADQHGSLVHRDHRVF